MHDSSFMSKDIDNSRMRIEDLPLDSQITVRNMDQSIESIEEVLHDSP